MDLTDSGPEGLDAHTDWTEAAREFRTQFPRCPKPEMIQAVREGMLPADLRDSVSQHVAHCAACAALAKDLDELDEKPLQANEQERIWERIQSGIGTEEMKPPAAARRPAWWQVFLRPMPLAVAAVAVILVTIGVRSMQHAQEPVAVNVTTPPPIAPRAPSALRLEKPPVLMPAAAVLVWRGGSDTGNEARQALQDALVPYEADHYADAAERLAALSKNYPSMAEAKFYLGICELFLDQNTEAVTNLAAAHRQAAPALADDAAWFLALAYHRNGRDADARPVLEKLCNGDGKDTARACAGVTELTAGH
jgi:TolA-binding protein